MGPVHVRSVLRLLEAGRQRDPTFLDLPDHFRTFNGRVRNIPHELHAVIPGSFPGSIEIDLLWRSVADGHGQPLSDRHPCTRGFLDRACKEPGLVVELPRALEPDRVFAVADMPSPTYVITALPERPVTGSPATFRARIEPSANPSISTVISRSASNVNCPVTGLGEPVGPRKPAVAEGAGELGVAEGAGELVSAGTPTIASPGRNRVPTTTAMRTTAATAADLDEGIHCLGPPRRPPGSPLGRRGQLGQHGIQDAVRDPIRAGLEPGPDDACGVAFGLHWAASRATGRASASRAARSARIA